VPYALVSGKSDKKLGGSTCHVTRLASGSGKDEDGLGAATSSTLLQVVASGRASETSTETTTKAATKTTAKTTAKTATETATKLTDFNVSSREGAGHASHEGKS
jgi:hypothetical protein